MSDQSDFLEKCKSCAENPYCVVFRIPKKEYIPKLIKKCPCKDCILKPMCTEGCPEWNSKIHDVAVDLEIYIRTGEI